MAEKESGKKSQERDGESGKDYSLKTEDVWKTYDGESYVLKEINLSIRPKEIVLIKGRSGSGKTTLLSLLGCIDSPSKGSIYFNGTDVSRLPDKKLAETRLKKIGIIFQTHNLISDLTVLENVLLPLKIAKDRESEVKASNLLKAFDIRDLSGKKPNEISGGERQRAAIARAMSNNPTVLLADEPTASLDLENCDIVIDAFKKANKEFGTTVIIASHDPVIEGVVDRTYYLSKGRIREEGTE